MSANGGDLLRLAAVRLRGVKEYGNFFKGSALISRSPRVIRGEDGRRRA